MCSCHSHKKITKAGCRIIFVFGIQDIGGLINVSLINLLAFELYLNSVPNYYITSLLNTVLLTRHRSKYHMESYGRLNIIVVVNRVCQKGGHRISDLFPIFRTKLSDNE